MLVPLLLALTGAANTQPSYSFMMWDWTASTQDVAVFRQRVDQCREAGFDTIDLTVAWKSIEPRRGEFDFSAADERVDYCRSRGMKVRLRLNVSYAHGWPNWYDAVLMTGRDGSTPNGVLSPFGPGAVDHWRRAAEALAAHFRDRVDCYMPGFGMHMEIKYGDWISYEPAAVRSFRTYLSSRYGSICSLNAAWGSSYASFDEVAPPVPAPPGPKPDLAQPSIDFIQFREDHLAYAADRFIEGFKKGYPGARVSVQLGESFRTGSADMSNQAYYRYSRLADEIVHSYDFFIHPHNHPHHAFESVATFAGTTGKPVVVEFDGPILFGNFGYTDTDLTAIARACLDAGASGIHISNYSDLDPRPVPFVGGIAQLTKSRTVKPLPADSLFYISKWTIYTLRTPGETLHERIYSYYRRLTARGERLRIISDENLAESLSGYRKLYISHAPVLSESAADALADLKARLPWEAEGDVGTFRVRVR